MKVTENSIIYKSDSLLEADMKDSLALMSIEEGSYYGLNPIGKEIWTNIKEPIRVQDLISHLLKEFTVEEELCKEETLSFLNNLLVRKMLHVRA